MRAITTFLAASLLLTGPALRAAGPAKAEEFLRVAKLEDMLKQAMELAGNQMKSGIIEQIADGQSKPEDVAGKDRIFSFVTSLFGWDTVKPIYVKIYSGAFTGEELDGIIALLQIARRPSHVGQDARAHAKGERGDAGAHGHHQP